MTRYVVFILGFVVWHWGAHSLQATEADGITLRLARTAEVSVSKDKVDIVLTAISKKPLPLRINFWTGINCTLEDIGGKELKWTSGGSDGLRVPPPTEAIPSLSDSGSVSVPLSVMLTVSKEEKDIKNTLLIMTKWGFGWWITPLPKEGVYLRATVRGNRHIDAEDFLVRMAVKGIGKEAYAQIYEGPLVSNRVWIGRDAAGILKVEPEQQEATLEN